MICLKNRTFAVSQTTQENTLPLSLALWFAWKIVLLQYRKQLPFYAKQIDNGCDLLEKSYFCSIANNTPYQGGSGIGLWFAWKIVLLQYRKQPSSIISEFKLGCDLLEKSYFCSIANNANSKFDCWVWVVICLKNRTFAVSQTTVRNRDYRSFSLWFAWKIVLLQYRKQLGCSSFSILGSCDLLEKSYFCSIANNLKVRLLKLN